MVEGERDRDEIHIKDTAGPGDDHISCSVHLPLAVKSSVAWKLTMGFHGFYT